MLVHVLVAMVLVDLQPQPRQLGQHVISQAGVHEQRQSTSRVRRHQQLDQLVTNALCGDDVDAVGHGPHRRHHLRCDVEAELGRESSRPHHPQRVVAEGVLRCTGCAQHPLDEVAQTAVRVDELPRWQPQRHGVDGEVTASEVALESVAVSHRRLARCRVVSVAAICRDLEDVVALAQPDGAVRDAGLPDVVGPGTDDRQDLLRSRVGREVEVLLQPAEQRVAY